MNYFNAALVLILFTVSGCNLSTVTTEENPLARVNDAFLFEDDIDFSFIQGQTKSDSIIYVQNIINDWATTQLLIDGAILNLNKDTQEDFEQLVQQYKKDLYTSAYVEALVKNNLDDSVSDQELKAVY